MRWRRTRSWARSKDPDSAGRRTRIVDLYTHPSEGATVFCVNELGPVIPRTLPPALGWSADGHRIKHEVDYGRGPEKFWVYDALRPADSQELTMPASGRNSAAYLQFLQVVEDTNPGGEIMVVTDNHSSHHSLATRTWLKAPPRIAHAVIPVGAAWLNLRQGWWRSYLKVALAGQSFATRPGSRPPQPWPPPSSTPSPRPGCGDGPTCAPPVAPVAPEVRLPPLRNRAPHV